MKKFNSETGVTLVEILIGVVISMIMMAAMFTSYNAVNNSCLLYTSPSPRDTRESRMPSSA